MSMPDSAFPSQAPAGSSHNPSIRLHNSTSPLGEQSLGDEIVSHMLLQSGLPDNSWGNVKPSQNSQSGSARPRQLGVFNNQQHKRASSGSSGVSIPATDAVSPLAPSATSFSPSAFGSYEGFDSSNRSSSSASKPLPTPEHTPVHTSFLAAPFHTYDPSSPRDSDHADVDMAMRRAILEQHKQQQAATEDDLPYSYSLAPSVSTLSHNSPATPQTNYTDDFEDGLKTLPNDFSSHVSAQMGLPRLNRTMSDIYQDELYNPAASTTSQARKVPTKGVKIFPPYRNVITDRIQAAHQGHMSARSNSPTSSINREQSPFRQGSPFGQPSSGYHLQQPSHLHSEIQLGGQQHSDMRGLDIVPEAPTEQGEPKTISPKDALLEYREPSGEHGMPDLPPVPEANQYHIHTAIGNSSGFQAGPNFGSMDTFSNQYEQASPITQQYSYLQHAQQHLPMQLQSRQAHRVQQPQGRRESNNPVQQTPEFRPQLSSMESSNSERTITEGNSSPSRPMRRTAAQPTEAVRRPDDTSSDLGTYSCTYHGCTLRFETPAKLQKHKRESHRQTTPGSHGGLRDGSAGSNALAMRNSQAGPHRCERINPSTGKPCNSIFSRPYDLTRHEDTIHNARKQKVRCHLCTEEKTFSRNDALTRHMRVVHPEIDWPGKQKRKGKD